MLVALYNWLYFTWYLVEYSDCALEAKIVGGTEAKIKDFPFSAYLTVKCEDKVSREKGAWICGSSILNQDMLLTAAHCLAGCSSNSWVSVSVGNAVAMKGVKSSGSKYIVHENYYPDTTINDIALLKLRTPLVFNKNVSRVVLMSKPPYHENAKVAGWGIVDESQNIFGATLYVIDQHVWNLAECVKLLTDIPPGTFCASGFDNEYAAGGDSGSALVVRGYIQIGLVSYKKPEVNKNVVVYTDTGFFYQWITENAMVLQCDE